MKRNRIDEVQFSTRGGIPSAAAPAGGAGSGGGPGGGPGGGGGVVSGSVVIGSVVASSAGGPPNSGSVGGAGGGGGGSAGVVSVVGGGGGVGVAHRILTPQHNTAPSIQYLNSAGNIKSSDSTPTLGGSSAPNIQYTTYYSYSGTMPKNAAPTSTMSSGNAQLQMLGNTGGGGNGGNAGIRNTSNKHTASNHPNQQGQQHPQQQQQQHQQQQQQHVTMNTSVGGGGSNISGPDKIQRLKVEDALSYLDQVKYKFGNQPQVYNDFLDIMKEFKSQSIDTPGVIQRVSNLFKGHPELIVGFNTFLPPGYKIEVQANDQGVAFQVSVSVPSPTGTNSIQITQSDSPPPTHKIGHSMSIVHTIAPSHQSSNPLIVVNSNILQQQQPQTNAQPLSMSVQHQQQQQQQQQQHQPPLASPHTTAIGHAQRQQQQQEPSSLSVLRERNAVSVQQSQATVVGNVHLSSAAIIGSAPSLGSGNSGTGAISVNLVNAPGPRTTPQHEATMQQLHSSSGLGPGAGPHGGIAGAAAGANVNDSVNSQGHALLHISQAHQIMQAEQKSNSSSSVNSTIGGGGGGGSSTCSDNGSAIGPGGQPVEFNHAISYVNKIKNRFLLQPEKYKRFLEILHAYQKEQKNLREGIGPSTKTLSEAEVYSQVAKLFDQQEDLLREFGQFLPDASNHTSGYGFKTTCSGLVLNDHHHHVKKTNMSALQPQQQQQQQQHLQQLHFQAQLAPHQQQPQQVAQHLQQATLSGGKTAYLTGLPMGSGSGPGSVSLITTGMDSDDAIMLADNKGYGQIVTGLGGNIAIRTMDKDRQHAGGAGSVGANATGNKYHAAHYNAGTVQQSPLQQQQQHHLHMQQQQQQQQQHHHLQQQQQHPVHLQQQQHLPQVPLHHAGDKRTASSVYLASNVSSIGVAGSAAGSLNLNRSGGGSNAADGHPPAKRQKPISRDITLADASKYGSLSDYAFFDKVRKALRNPDVYENFLRCLTLFNQEIISKSELVGLISPFLSRFPELHRWFQEFLGSSACPSGGAGAGPSSAAGQGHGHIESVPLSVAQRAGSDAHHRQSGGGAGGVGGAGGSGAGGSGLGGLGGAGGALSEYNNAQEIDLSTCKRLGASYCALPRNQESRKCTGRTALCREVLNDQWASFPTWAEDSTFVTSRKTHYEEIIYRCEDERFELDVVIETNSATIRVLEGVAKKMSRMPPEELTRYRLDDNLGGNSPTIHQRALRRIYGEKAADVIQGLKKNPMVAVPVALKRLKTKEEEWREAQKGFNKQWREQNEKYYLKSLDHQGINFKQTDIKALRSKSLFNEIEALYDERHEQTDENQPSSGPHLVLHYKDKTILEDASNLLIHHVKRQTSVQKQEKTKIKYILRQFLPDMFFSPRQQLSDDERDDDADASSSEQVASRYRRSEASNKAANQSTSGAYQASSSTQGGNHDGASSAADRLSFDEATAGKSPLTAGSAARNRSVSTASNQAPMVKAEPSGDVEMIDASTKNAADAKQRIGDATTDDLLQPVKTEAGASNNDEAYTLFFGSSNWYLFLRLHAILCDRLYSMYDQAKILLGEEMLHRNNRRESTATALRLKPKSDTKIEDYYPTFIDMLKNLLDGNMETNTYEDSLREMFGIHAYLAFTLDRVVTNAVRQLQHAVTERGAIECVELYQAQHKKNAAGGLCRTAPQRSSVELTYQRRAEAILHDENCFKVYFYKNNCRVSLELLDTETDETEKTVTNTQNWNTYVDQLKNPTASDLLPASSSSSSTTAGKTTALSSSAAPSAASSGAGAFGGSSSNAAATAAVEIKSEVSDADTNRFFLNRRPLFLNRNIRRFKKHHSQKLSMSSSKDIAITGVAGPTKRCNATDATAANATATTTTTAASSSTSASSSSCSPTSQPNDAAPTNAVVAKRPSADGTTGSSAKSAGADERPANVLDDGARKAGGDESDSKLTLGDSYWSRKPQRLGVSVGGREDYVIDDCAEMQLNMQSYRMVFVMNKDVIFYKHNSLLNSRKAHPAVTRAMAAKFYKYVEAWCKTNVTETQFQRCCDWFMGRDKDAITNTTAQIQSTNDSRTPYRVFNRYRCK